MFTMSSEGVIPIHESIEVELRGSIVRLENDELAIRGVWYFTGVGRGDNFEWRAAGNKYTLDQYGVPKKMVCTGSFDAFFSSVKEEDIVLEFSPDRWINSQTNSTIRSSSTSHDADSQRETRRRNLYSNPEIADASSSSSAALEKTCRNRRMLYSVVGRGINGIGKFEIKGLLNVSLTWKSSNTAQTCLESEPPTSTLFRFHAKKTYASPQNEESVTFGQHLLQSSRNTMDDRIPAVNPTRQPKEPRAHHDESTTKRKRKRVETPTNPTAEEARLRAQHWRRQQLRNSSRNNRNTFYIRTTLPRPVIREAKQLRNRRLLVSWEIATQASFALAIMTETSLSIRRIRSYEENSEDQTKQQVVDFPPFALTREKGLPLGTFSPTRNFSHVLEDLSPGLYEVCVLVRPCGNPAISDQTFDTVRVAINLPPPAPDKVTALTYAVSRNAKRYAVVSWNIPDGHGHVLSPTAASVGSKPRFIGQDQVINSYEICCQVYRKTRCDWVTHEPSKRVVTVRNDMNSSLSVCNCIVSDLPRNDKIRITVAAIGPDGPGQFAASSSLDCSSTTKSSNCKPNCVICGDDISFSESNLSEESHDDNIANGDSSAAGPDCCSHLFHFGCLRRWCNTKNQWNSNGEMESTCPLCCRSFTGMVKHKLKLAQQDDRVVVTISNELKQTFLPTPLPQHLQESEWDYPFIRDVYEAIFGEPPSNPIWHTQSNQEGENSTNVDNHNDSRALFGSTRLQREHDALLAQIINESI